MVSTPLLYFMVCEIDLFHFVSHPVESETLKSNLVLLKHRLKQLVSGGIKSETFCLRDDIGRRVSSCIRTDIYNFGERFSFFLR